MATAQMSRTETKEGQWSSVFPPEQVTEQQSTMFIKKLLAVAISSISYLRALFPEVAFGDRCLEDISLKILRDDGACPEACQVINWIKGCFDALEKKYLRAVLVGIYEDPEDPDTILEQYTFKVSYSDGNTKMEMFKNGKQEMSAQSSQETQKQTIRLLRTIILLSQTFSPLPDDVMMTMKLLYYDDVTPEDYNPPGFKDCAIEGFAFKDDPMNIKVGDVETPFHSFRVRIKTTQHELQQPSQSQENEASAEPSSQPTDGVADQSSQPSDANVELSSQPTTDAIVEPHVAIEEERPAQDIPSSTTEQLDDDSQRMVDDTSPHLPTDQSLYEDERPAIMQQEERPPLAEICSSSVDKQNTRTGTPATSQASSQEQQDQIVLCPCGDQDDDGMMILCSTCQNWQHGTCFSILKEDQAPDNHYCVTCAKKNEGILCTDPHLMELQTDIKIQELCLWRRALCAVLEDSRILPTRLSKRLSIPIETANKVLKRMEKEGFIVAAGKTKRFGKVVQKDEIRGRGFNKYFYHADEMSADFELPDESCSILQQDSEMTTVTDQAAQMQIETGQRSASKRKSTEKVYYQHDESLQFELANSQASDSPLQRRTKRRKTSVTTKPMLL